MAYSFTEKKRIRNSFGKRPGIMDVPNLLAIQVNNANEERKNRALERAYLSDIHQDFIDNKNQFEERLQTFRNQFQIADSLCRHVFPLTDKN